MACDGGQEDGSLDACARDVYAVTGEWRNGRGGEGEVAAYTS